MNVINISQVTKIRELIEVGDNWYSRMQRLNNTPNSERAIVLSNKMRGRMVRLCDVLSKSDIVRMPNWMIDIMMPTIK